MSDINFMVVDGSLADLVAELTAYIETLGCDELEANCQRALGSGDESKVFELITQQLSLLNKSPEAQFESVWLLALHVFSFSESSEWVDAVLKALSGHANLPRSFNGPAAAGQAVVAVQAALFNMLSTHDDSLLASTLLAALATAEETGNLHLLAGQLKSDQTVTWINTWQLDAGVRDTLISKLYAALVSLDEPAKALALLIAAVGNTQTSTFPQTCQLVQQALKSDHVYDFSAILALEPVADLKTTEQRLFELLTTVASGDVAKMTSLANGDGKSLIEENDFDSEALLAKTRVIALANLAAEHPELEYSAIAKTLDVAPETVELWVIDTIRAGLVEGRLSQTKQSFAVHRAQKSGAVTKEDWEVISQRLDVWKKSITDVLHVVKQARENAHQQKRKIAA
ncbi:Eukaryotic translation initiation factor 3 subunit M [Yarrowia sp. B02]|nr:Eukaryotic translation initiation factor 3 subunit M [Yarrowia sp. B02]